VRAGLLLLALSGCSADPTCVSSADCREGAVCVDRECVRSDAAAIDARVSLDASVDARPDAALPDARAFDAGPRCVPVSSSDLVCDGVDDDCNGSIDDVDLGGDGICDCLSIGILGRPGANPSANFQAWLESRGTTTTRFGVDGGETLTAAMLEPFAVIVIDGLPREYTDAEASALAAFVEAGGGVMAMTGHDGGADRPNANSLLAGLGASYLAGLVNGPVTDFVPHPLTTGLASVTFAGGYHIESTTASTVVARLPGGTAGLAIERGLGRVFVWGDEWVEFDSEWTTMPMIVAFWVNVLSWIAPPTECRGLI
jgi:hypothetical protein